MVERDEEKIRRRAYELWESEGCPDGGAEAYWFRAEREIAGAAADDAGGAAHDTAATTDEISRTEAAQPGLNEARGDEAISKT
jgi:Protein of unknown function (DUF2934)